MNVMALERKNLISCLLLFSLVLSVKAHDLFLKFDTYFLRANAKATVRLLNGTFRVSESAVPRDRIQDVSVVTPAAGITHPQETVWHNEGKTALIDLETGEAGTYVIGVSTKHKEYDFKAAEFNKYLVHDGIPDVLAQRRKRGELGEDARERYSKHVRAIFQVGDARTDSYKTLLNYPLEIIPQQNPYALTVGQTIEVLCTLEGQPLVNQSVTFGWESTGRASRPLTTRTNARGIARFKLISPGKWYVKTVHISKLANSAVNYESNWATLTFEIR